MSEQEQTSKKQELNARGEEVIRNEKGQVIQGTPNPNGRPKGTISVVTAIKRKLKEMPEGQKATYLDLLIKQIFKKAIAEGDVSMIKDIINRVDGMPKQSLEMGLDQTIEKIKIEIDGAEVKRNDNPSKEPDRIPEAN